MNPQIIYKELKKEKKIKLNLNKMYNKLKK